jgi:hypothetical protein
VALLLAGSNDGHTAELFQLLAHHANPDGCLEPGFATQAHAWLYAKQCAFGNQVEAFLATATGLLRNGRVPEPALWFATIDEVVGFCRFLGSDGSRLADRMALEADRMRSQAHGPASRVQ